MSEEKRVILIKPGDVVLIGNVGSLSYEEVEGMRPSLVKLAEKLGLRVALFESDITMDVASSESAPCA